MNTFHDNHYQKPGDPTPAEIAERAAAIRATCPDEVARKRLGETVEAPVVQTVRMEWGQRTWEAEA